MPKIRFISSPKIPNDKIKEWSGYIKGSVHEVSDSETERWLNRGNAEIVKEIGLVISKPTPNIPDAIVVEEIEEKVEEVKEEKVEEGIEEIAEILTQTNFPRSTSRRKVI